MKNLKRALSFALATVMVIGMMVVGAGAAFTDADKIANEEAVDVMVALGVISGKGDGTYFDPAATLTRAEAAKIITYMLLGPKKAELLGTTGVKFSDVPAGHWAETYIGYCSNMGIISGYNGEFNPTGELTGLAFGKMLLGALGYDATVEGYTGDDWGINVAVDMVAAGIDLGDDVVLADALSRDDACQMAFNTLTATIVKYTSKGTQVTINGAVIATGATAAEAESEAGYTTYKASGAATAGLQFCEKHFKDLKLATATQDAFNRPATVWQYAPATAETVTVTAAEKADYTFNGKVTLGTLYTTLGAELLGKIDADGNGTKGDILVYVNGNDTAYTTNVTPIKNSTTDFATTANGTVTEIFVDKTYGSEVVTAVIYDTYIGTVKKVTPADDAGNDRFVTLTNGKTFETELFAVKDVVRYTEIDEDGATPTKAPVIKSMELAELVTGTLTKIVNGTEDVYTVNGVEYKVSKNGVTAISTTKLEKEVSFYVDAQKNILMDKGAAAATDNYIFVLGNADAKAAANYLDSTLTHTVEVYGVLTDGTVVTKTVESVGGSPVAGVYASDLDTVLYTFKDTDNDGLLELTEEYASAWGSPIALKATSADSKFLNSETIFVFVEVKSATDATVKATTVKVGNANFGADIAADKAFIGYDADNVAEVVFVKDVFVDGTADSGDVVFFNAAAEAAVTTWVGTTSKVVYQYKGVNAAGEKITVTSDAQLNGGSDVTGIYKYNKDLTVGTEKTSYNGIVTAINGSAVTVGGTYNLTDDTLVTFTKDDVELAVGQSVYFTLGTTTKANDYANIFVAADQVTVGLTLVDSMDGAAVTTTAYEVIKADGVDNKITIKIVKDTGTFAIGTYSLSDSISGASESATTCELTEASNTLTFTVTINTVTATAPATVQYTVTNASAS